MIKSRLSCGTDVICELSIDYSFLGPFIGPFWCLKGHINGPKYGEITNISKTLRLKVLKPIRRFGIVHQVLLVKY